MASETTETPIIDYLHVKDKNNTEKIVLPITKEKAITDKNGQRLDIKLEKMQRDISIATGGELPDGILYVPDGATAPETAPVLDADTLQGHGADYFAAKEDVPEAWDYSVPNNQPITFDTQYRILDSPGGTWVVQKYQNNTWQSWLYITADGILHYVEDANFQKGVAIAGDFSVDGALNATGISQFNGQIKLANDRGFFIKSADGTDKFYMFVSTDNIFKMVTYSGTAWNETFTIRLDNGLIDFKKPTNIIAGCNVYSSKPIDFLNSANAFSAHRIIRTDNTQFTIQARGGASEAWKDALYINNQGNVTFTKNIAAPNIPTTTALMEAEQEITEQDLALIAAEQANTDLDLRLTALEAKEGLNGI